MTLILFLGLAAVSFAKAGDNRVAVKRRGDSRQPVLYIHNDYFCPVEVEIHLVQGQEMTAARPPLPGRFVAAARSDTDAVLLEPAPPDRDVWSYRFQYRYTPGDSGAQHRPPKPYLPPFEKGKRFRIIKGIHDGGNDSYSACAVNILMPAGTPVCTARSGIVVDAVRESPVADSHTSRIMLLHDDGTLAVYANLGMDSDLVVPGTTVHEGQVIGSCQISGGNTDPNLYFAILKNAGMRLVSIPFEFAGEGGKAVSPVRGMILERAE